MIWTVEGTDAESGAPWALDIEAISAEIASKLASRQGMKVDAVHPFKPSDEAEPEQALPQAAHASLPDQQSPNETREYLELLVVARILIVFGWITIIAGPIVLLGIKGNAGLKFLSALGTISSGILLLAVGYVSLAIRDIAQDRYRR